jgi:hypothetical protein
MFTNRTSGAALAQAASGTSLWGAVYFPDGPVSPNGASGVGNGAGQCLNPVGSTVSLAGGTTAASSCIGGGNWGTLFPSPRKAVQTARPRRPMAAMHAAGRYDRGAAAVEFVVLAAVFLLIMAAFMDFGGVLYTKVGLGTASSQATNDAALNVSSANFKSARGLATVAANTEGVAGANVAVTVNAGSSPTSTSGAITVSGTASAADACYCSTGRATDHHWRPDQPPPA